MNKNAGADDEGMDFSLNRESCAKRDETAAVPE